MNCETAEGQGKEKFYNSKNCFIFAPPKKGVVAQMVEQRTENPCVTGSIPVDATPKSK